MVSVDGLHPGALARGRVEAFPAFERVLRGPHTLDARTDPDITITLPNHLGMVTGLPTIEHRWTANDEPPAARHGGTLHKKTGRYVPSMFDVAHDRGVATGIFCGKDKFWLFEQTWGEDEAAADPLPPEHGRRKIDLFVHAESSATLTQQLSARLIAAGDGATLDFLHLADPDHAGHATRWDLTPGSPYMQAVGRADAALRILFQALDGTERLRGTVAIVLTADHGGGEPAWSHTDPAAPCNFTVPLAIWLGADAAPVDLRALNSGTRASPSSRTQLPAGVMPPPIRNGEAGNISLQILGLPPIPGSRMNGRHDLRFSGAGVAARSANPGAGS